MPEPARVYCDFENNFPNFYLFKGFSKDKKQVLEGTDSPEGIRRNCGQLGLEPAEIKSESVFLKVLKYLRDSGSASEDGLAIPIAYKYENGAEAPYRSFNDRESDVCLDSFKKFIKPSHIQVDPLYGDAFVLSEEMDKVKKSEPEGPEDQGRRLQSQRRGTRSQRGGRDPHHLQGRHQHGQCHNRQHALLHLSRRLLRGQGVQGFREFQEGLFLGALQYLQSGRLHGADQG